MSTAETNKDVIRELRDSFNAHDIPRLMACYAPSIVVHASDGSERTMDHEEHADEVERMYHVFPDVTAQIDHMIADERSVFLRGSYTATHAGASEGSSIEPTGKTATWAWWCEYRLEDGKVVEAWNIYDGVSQLKQFGLWREPGPSDDE